MTNVGYAHTEYFDSIEGVAAAKRELIEALPADGVAVLNADDSRVVEFRNAVGQAIRLSKVTGESPVPPGRSVTFGFSDGADVRGRKLELAADGSRFEVDGVPFDIPLPGRHGVDSE